MTDTELTEALLERIGDGESAPFLFVGSGLSRRYLGLENWESLLRKFALLGGNPYPYYAAQAGRDNLPKVASLIADDYFKLWWEKDEFREEREKYGESCASKSSPLKFSIANYIEESSDLGRIPAELHEEVELLSQVQIDGIITTNWDSFLEQVFPDFTVFVGQREAIFARSYSVAEIFKIHGSHTQPNSLVLTEEDYSEYNARNKYLAAKLITTFLEHPVVFFGYSLSDDNIREILSSVLDCLDEERVELLRKRLVFVQRATDGVAPSISESTISIGDRDLRVTTANATSFGPVYRALASTERRISAKLLRQLKDHLYELVRTNDPTEQIAVVDIENLDSFKDVDIVVGVGIASELGEKGFKPITMSEIYSDVVHGEHRFDGRAKEVVEYTLASNIKGNRKNVPIFKYLRLAGLLDENGRPCRGQMPENVFENAMLDKASFEDTAYAYKRGEVQGMSIRDLEAQYGPGRACAYITFTYPDVNELEEFLRRNYSLLDDKNSGNWYRKLICIYDRLKYGPGFPVEAADC
ncbi:MAG TPA: SIR2 family protein [Longimicrobiaceae bacterium]|nr:SIR2 family protein [Longimicrobiaceae bacterium]